MKKLFFSILLLTLISCDFKDKKGNAPLIEDANGTLIDNPAYSEKTEIDTTTNFVEDTPKKFRVPGVDFEVDEKEEAKIDIEKREDFAKSFKPKTGKNEISLSGKDKTTITFTGTFNTPFTREQFENLNYFDEMKPYGFKKVLFSNGLKIVATKKL